MTSESDVFADLLTLPNREIVDCGPFYEVTFFCISPKNLLGDFFYSLNNLGQRWLSAIRLLTGLESLGNSEQMRDKTIPQRRQLDHLVSVVSSSDRRCWRQINQIQRTQLCHETHKQVRLKMG